MDLKSYYDKAITAEAEVTRIKGEIDTLITAHDEATDAAVKAEKMAAALEMRPSLDAAKAQAKEVNALYLSMRGASEGGGVKPLFVPAVPDAQTTAQPKQMTRTAFQALSPKERMSYVKDGGQVVDELPKEA
jgi:hypothetical protein